jgi:hypothetical protein
MAEGTAPYTHYAWFDRPDFKPTSWVQAVCGANIQRRYSDPHPTCPACQAILSAHDAEPAPTVTECER